MRHISKIDSISYDIMEGVCPASGKTYDITVIMRFPPDDSDGEDCSEVQLVGWHSGGYDYEVAEYYIHEYVTGKSNINHAAAKEKK